MATNRMVTCLLLLTLPLVVRAEADTPAAPRKKHASLFFAGGPIPDDFYTVGGPPCRTYLAGVVKAGDEVIAREAPLWPLHVTARWPIDGKDTTITFPDLREGDVLPA